MFSPCLPNVAKLADGKAKDPVVVGTAPVCPACFCLTRLRVRWYETVITLGKLPTFPERLTEFDGCSALYLDRIVDGVVKVQYLRCASSFVTVTYAKYASFLRIRGALLERSGNPAVGDLDLFT